MTHIDPKHPGMSAQNAARPDSGARESAQGVNPPESVTHDATPVRSSKQVRQGRPGRPVLYVLIAGLVLAMLAWAAAELLTGGASRFTGSSNPSTTGTANQQPTAGGIPLSAPVGSPEGSASQGQTSPGAAGRGSSSAPSPSSDSAR